MPLLKALVGIPLSFLACVWRLYRGEIITFVCGTALLLFAIGVGKLLKHQGKAFDEMMEDMWDQQ